MWRRDGGDSVTHVFEGCRWEVVSDDTSSKAARHSLVPVALTLHNVFCRRYSIRAVVRGEKAEKHKLGRDHERMLLERWQPKHKAGGQIKSGVVSSDHHLPSTNVAAVVPPEIMVMSVGLGMPRWQNQASSRMKRIDRFGLFHHTRQWLPQASGTSAQKHDSSIPILDGRGGLISS